MVEIKDMDNHVPSLQYVSQHPDVLENSWGHQYMDYSFDLDNAQYTQQPSTYQPQGYTEMSKIGGKGPMTQLLSHIHPSSYVRAYNPATKSSITRRPGPGQASKQRAKPTRPSKLGRNPKRQKVVLVLDSSDAEAADTVRCESVTGSQSECCSSCPDSPPCDESDCCAEPACAKSVVVEACYKPSCEKPVCSEPCLAAGIRAQQTMGPLPIESRTTNWLAEQWLPQILRNLPQIDPALAGGIESYFPSSSASPSPTTPSICHNTGTPYSPGNDLLTPRYSGFSPQTYHTQPNGTLSGAGAALNPAYWQSYAIGTNNPQSIDCLWTGCHEQSFTDEQQWLSHLHNTHIDPQISFGCPIQSESCPQTIDTNPLNHLEMNHGYNFDMNGNGFTCPAPTCLPGEMFFSPSMFHNHFDHAHGVPAQGSLHCRLETCDTTFVDPQDLMVHIKQHHKLPVALPIGDEIEHSISTETANILASLPKAGSMKSENALEADVEYSNKEVVHVCKWKSDQDDACGVICISEEELQKHVKYEHLEQLDKSSGYKCQWEDCGRDSRRGEKSGFSQRGKLERHMATHTGFKCCACEECGKTFSAEQSLRQHVLLHKGEKPWKCKHCGKGFPQQSACTIHERTHTKEKPLECAVCGKRFSESSNLSKHRKIHGEKGLNTCDFPECGKSFHRLDQLKRHKATHEKHMARLRESIVRSDGLRTESELSE